MCATGLPYPQKDHAVRMVRFARDCLLKLTLVLSDLEDELGEDTVQLRMRVGIPSGPTTGGVLRGKKGRFQLFGDTVNCASRMESTSMPGRIQISQATADALKAHGKGAWFSPREEKIEAKGKGFLQTYWINTEVTPNATTRHSTTDASDRPDPTIGGLYLGSPKLRGTLSEDGGLVGCDADDDVSAAGSLKEEIMLATQLNDYLRRGGTNSHSEESRPSS